MTNPLIETIDAQEWLAYRRVDQHPGLVWRVHRLSLHERWHRVEGIKMTVVRALRGTT